MRDPADSENEAGSTYEDPYADESQADNPPERYVGENEASSSPQGIDVREQAAEEVRHQPQRPPQARQQIPADGTQTMAIDLGTGAETGDLGEQVYQAVEEATVLPGRAPMSSSQPRSRALSSGSSI